jgi:hypothetical protein
MPHWRDHLNSSLLGAYSLYDDATDRFKQIDGFILRCTHEEHLLGASGKRDCFVAYTSIDPKKPMKINVTIAFTLEIAAGSRNPDKWVNIPVTFFVDERVKTKEGIVAALRVKRRIAPDYSKEIESIKSCTTIEQLQAVYFGLTKDAQLACVQAKDEMKLKLIKQ